jgi:hypothetical protein
LLAYMRRASNADRCRSESALVLLNFRDETIDLRLSPANAVASSLRENQLRDRLTGVDFTNPASKPLRLGPFDARILTTDTASCD